MSIRTMQRHRCACGRDPVIGDTGDGRWLALCQRCLDEAVDEEAEQRAPGAWSGDTCLCGAPLERGQGLCAACEERADREGRDVARAASRRPMRRWAGPFAANGRAA